MLYHKECDKTQTNIKWLRYHFLIFFCHFTNQFLLLIHGHLTFVARHHSTTGVTNINYRYACELWALTQIVFYSHLPFVLLRFLLLLLLHIWFFLDKNVLFVYTSMIYNCCYQKPWTLLIRSSQKLHGRLPLISTCSHHFKPNISLHTYHNVNGKTLCS
jgi:hypothetical protein